MFVDKRLTFKGAHDLIENRLESLRGVLKIVAEQAQLSPTQKQEVERQYEQLKTGVVEIVPEAGLKGKLTQSILSGIPLNIKLGLDPTAPDIHIGHTVVIQKLRQFQDMGHQIHLILGDFTGRIGDPTGKSQTRKQLTSEQVQENAKSYVQQYGKILDMTKTKVYYNSEWLDKLAFADVLQLSATTTVARMLERDDFQKRYESNQPISIHEFFYPLMQGYDSVALHSDVELGGTDQKFNLLMGRHVQKEYRQEQQVIITTPLLEGLDGVQKMSKSLGNYIGIAEEPNEIFGKAMSIPDECMLKYIQLATFMPLQEVEQLRLGLDNGSIHPRDAKMNLAHTLVALYHDEDHADQAREHFKTIFQKRDHPQDMPEQSWTQQNPSNIVDFISALGLVASKGEGRRMVCQGAVKIDAVKIGDIKQSIDVKEGMIVQVGKRKFLRISE